MVHAYLILYIFFVDANFECRRSPTVGGAIQPSAMSQQYSAPLAE